MLTRTIAQFRNSIRPSQYFEYFAGFDIDFKALGGFG